MRSALAGVAVSVGLCVSSFAQHTDRSTGGSALNRPAIRFPSLNLAENNSFIFPAAFNRMEATWPAFLPSLDMANVTARSTSPARASFSEDAYKEVVSVRKSLLDNVHGEVGFFYGSGSGRFARDVEGGYVLGTVGDEKFSITAGASYEHSSRRR